MVNYSKTILSLLAISTPAEAYWRMSCGLIQTGRIDPIITPGKVSGHVHKVSGASNFGLSSTFSTLQASRCTSCEIQDDKSAYWTPQLFFQHANGSFEMVPNQGTVVYYLGRGENRSNTEPFPPGFKMLSGNPTLRALDSTTMTYNRTGYPGRPLSDRVSFACLDSSGPLAETSYMKRTDCDNGMRAQIQFPTCWNGGDYQADQSHVAYMSQIDNGVCPPTHPRQLPHLFFEVIYGVNNVDKSKGGQFVFAQGDTTGYGFHGDFFNAWNPDTLSSAVKQCLNNDTIAGSISACAPLAKSQTPYFSTNCPERPAIVNETVRGMLSKLPGCNPVTSGPAPAPQQICPVQPTTQDVADNSTDMFNPAVGDKIGTWAYLGCAPEGTSARTLSQYATAADNMTIGSCTAACKAQGWPLAGLENGRECYCAGALTKGVSYNSASACSSTYQMICSGNSSQWCGAPNFLTIFNDTSYKAPAPLVVNSTKILNGTASYYGCWTEGTSGRALTEDSFTSSSMTNEMCVAYCNSGGYLFAATEYADECYCGNTIANGGKNTSDTTQCSMKCKGDVLSYCGAGNRLSVWQIAQSAKSTTPVTALGGSATYLGCYTDGGAGGRTLSNASFANSTLTLESCAAFCKAKGLPLFGMEYSSECYCGVAPKTQATLASDGDCRMKCAGNSSEICGGSSRISIWNQTLLTTNEDTKKTASSNTKSKTNTYVGCYTEGSKGKALPLAHTSDAKKMTIEMCATFCAAKKYAYMGLENGSDCYCNTLGPSNGSSKTSESQCNVKCKGNSGETCGAKNRLNVWKVAGV